MTTKQQQIGSTALLFAILILGTIIVLLTPGVIGPLAAVAVGFCKGCLALIPGFIWPTAVLVIVLWILSLGKAWGKIG